MPKFVAQPSSMRFLQRMFQRIDSEECRQILLSANPYYIALRPQEKSRFLKRTITFIRHTAFYADGGLPLDMRIKTIVSSAFIQITFGLKAYTLRNFHRIIITPSSYTYPGYDQLMSGDVNTVTKTVSLSWPAVQQGFEVPGDALNIAIHEFGHCLAFENFSHPYLGRFLHDVHWEAWAKTAVQKLEEVKAGRHQLLRPYGGTNLMELFAVSLENFFERPVAFKNQSPQYYKLLSTLLNQDPTNMRDPVLHPLHR